jgi:hypothetical protein
MHKSSEAAAEQHSTEEVYWVWPGQEVVTLSQLPLDCLNHKFGTQYRVQVSSAENDAFWQQLAVAVQTPDSRQFSSRRAHCVTHV